MQQAVRNHKLDGIQGLFSPSDEPSSGMSADFDKREIHAAAILFSAKICQICLRAVCRAVIFRSCDTIFYAGRAGGGIHNFKSYVSAGE